MNLLRLTAANIVVAMTSIVAVLWIAVVNDHDRGFALSVLIGGGYWLSWLTSIALSVISIIKIARRTDRSRRTIAVAIVNVCLAAVMSVPTIFYVLGVATRPA